MFYPYLDLALKLRTQYFWAQLHDKLVVVKTMNLSKSRSNKEDLSDILVQIDNAESALNLKLDSKAWRIESAQPWEKTPPKPECYHGSRLLISIGEVDSAQESRVSHYRNRLHVLNF